MGYCIKYDDIRALLNTCSTQFNNWQSQLQNILSASNGITGMAAFKGDAAASVKAYMQEVHNVLIYAILQAIAEFRSKLLLYSDGFYRIEADKYAELSEDALQAALTKYDGYCRNFVDDSCRLSSALNNVRDIFNVSPPSSYPVCGDYDTFKKRVSKLKDDVGSYERSKLGSDMLDLAAMIKQLKATIKDFSSKSANSISSYQPGSVAASWSFQDLCRQLNRSVAYCDSHADAIRVAGDHEIKIEEDIAAEERQKQAVWDAVLSGLAIIGGIFLIVVSAGTATPLVIVGVAGTMAYSTSNIIEDIQIINDPYTAAFNPIRDTIFMGNQTAYDIFGFASAMMVPVGMGIQSAVAANSSVMRAVGTTLAKQGLTMAAGYGTDKAGEALGLPPELRMLMSMGAMTVAGYGVEALDTRFNVSGYHVTSKMPQFGFSDYMDSEDAASYNKHWDDLASGKHLPPGMDVDDLARYNLGAQKANENLALSKVDAEAFAKLRAQEAARLKTPVSEEIKALNNKGVPYPKVEVDGYGKVGLPPGPYEPNNSKTLRPQFTESYKKQFKEWWIEQGRAWPEGEVNIHHIKPLSKGGDNSFENLVPLIQPDEHQPFTNWWRDFP